MIRLVRKYNPNGYQYDQYLNAHILGVKRAWHEILKPAMLENFDVSLETIQEISDVISVHDNSKFDEIEYNEYLNYFYPSPECPKDEHLFNIAWNHHQKCNPHHWQYWILIGDGAHIQCLDMPLKYVAEMCCDWHSFSLTDKPENTAYNWWKSRKDLIMVSPKTSKLIDEIVEYLKDPIEAKTEESSESTQISSYSYSIGKSE